ncbi:MAG: hypothetical protein K2I89_05760 [Muribaculaceae bacterium]|nr:hypothetical protein [Muribaculaceae bacterium]
MKQILRIMAVVGTVICLFLMSSCSTDDGLRVDYSKLRLGRMDLSGAVSLGLKTAGSSSRAIEGEYLSAGLYKIDAAGNISAVGVYFTTDETGNRLEHEEVLNVAPRAIFNLTDNYLLALDCSYYDRDGDYVNGKFDGDNWIPQDVPYHSLLVRKSDGKIWCVDNIVGMLQYGSYEGGDFHLKLSGTYKEVSGVLYYNYKGYIYRFNFADDSASFEQITKNPNSYSSFHILDNGVVWSWTNSEYGYRSYGNFSWFNSGFSWFNSSDVFEEWYSNNLPVLSLSDIAEELSSCEIECLWSSGMSLILSEIGGKPILIATVPGGRFSVFDRYSEQYINHMKYSDKIREYIVENRPTAMMFEINVGDIPGSVSLNDNPIILKYQYGDDIVFYSNQFELSWTSISSYLFGENYILVVLADKTLTKIDTKKRTWEIIKKLDFTPELENLYREKAWKISDSASPFGAYWFDTITYEDGFINFKVEIPSYMHRSDFINGKVIYSGLNQTTGNKETIVIDITTGEGVHSVTEAEMYFETLIPLN